MRHFRAHTFPTSSFWINKSISKIESIANLIAASFTLPLIGSCASTIGPHGIRSDFQKGVKISNIEGYGLQILNLPDFHGFRIGYVKQTLVFNEDDTDGWMPDTGQVRFYTRLPEAAPIHCSSFCIGPEFAWEPGFRGAAAGFQFRSTSRLPLDTGMALEVMTTASESASQTFSLLKFQ